MQARTVRRFALELPDAEERETWETATFRVRGKIFAMFSERERHVWIKSVHDEQRALVAMDAEAWFVPPYVGPSGWVGAVLSKADGDEVRIPGGGGIIIIPIIAIPGICIPGIGGGKVPGTTGIPGNGNDVVVAPGEIACRRHPERGGQGGASVARAVGIVGRFRAQQEAVEALECADGVDSGRPPGEHFVDVALMSDIEHQLVRRGGKHPVQGDGEFHDAEVGTQMAAGLGQRSDQRLPNLGGQLQQLLVGEALDVVRRFNGRKKPAKRGGVRRGGCRHRRWNHPPGSGAGRD